MEIYCFWTTLVVLYRSQIISVVCQIQRFDFDCILVVSRKVII
jgi:hypothetical protein